MIPFGEYMPDVPADLSAIIDGRNVYPRADGAYGPVASFASTVATIAARCQGATFAIDKDLNVSAYAGTAGKLYKLAGGGSSWTDVSKAGTYSTATADTWEFDIFNQKLIATNFADPIQTFTLGVSSQFADLAAAAPKARHIAVVNRFLMAGNTFTLADGNQPQRLWWSAIDDPTSWPTPATSAAAAVQSGYQTLFGSAGVIQGIAPKVGALDAIVVQERGLIRVQYIGSPDVFALQPLEGGRGSPAPNSITPYGGFLYYLGEDGFYVCDGAQSIPIGAGKVDKTFWADVNQSYLYRVCGVYDPFNHLWIVGYPSTSSTNGDIDRIMSFNTVTRRWAPPWEVTIELLCKLGSVGYTLEQLDAFGTMDTLPASLDSRIWAGSGKPILAGFAPTTHALGYFTGNALEAELETGEADGQGARFMTRGIRPVVAGTSATVTCKVGYRDNKAASVSYSAATSTNRAGVSPIRKNARYTRAVVTIAAGGSWSHLQGFELDQVNAGSM